MRDDWEMDSISCTYLLPIRRSLFDRMEADELSHYFALVRPAVSEIIVVDGSVSDVFQQHHECWAHICRHEGVDPRFHYLNDKVNGVHTGVALARSGKIILADDDIRYTASDIERIGALLEEFEVVRPQNYLGRIEVASTSPGAPKPGEERSRRSDLKHHVHATLPWWAKMETARMLINRATLRLADYPGTCAFRRDTIIQAGDYDGDVLFDNEEILRHFARAGARVHYANDFFIAKRPPKFRKWLEQRPRQAYEDFGLRTKTALFAAVLPLLFCLTIFGGLKYLLAAVLLLGATSILLASAGRVRGSARKFFSPYLCLFAPLWILERSLSTYWAFYWFVRRGGYPFGNRLLRKGIGRDWFAGAKIVSGTTANK